MTLPTFIAQSISGEPTVYKFSLWKLQLWQPPCVLFIRSPHAAGLKSHQSLRILSTYEFCILATCYSNDPLFVLASLYLPLGSPFPHWLWFGQQDKSKLEKCWPTGACPLLLYRGTPRTLHEEALASLLRIRRPYGTTMHHLLPRPPHQPAHLYVREAMLDHVAPAKLPADYRDQPGQPKPKEPPRWPMEL